MGDVEDVVALAGWRCDDQALALKLLERVGDGRAADVQKARDLDNAEPCPGRQSAVDDGLFDYAVDYVVKAQEGGFASAPPL